MKMNEIDYAILKHHLMEGINRLPHLKEVKENINSLENIKDHDKAFRWHLYFHCADEHMKDRLRHLDDNHIDTALKKAMIEIEELLSSKEA